MPSTRAILDVAAGGAFTKRNSHEAYKLLEDMAESHMSWNLEHQSTKRLNATVEVDALAALLAQLEAMNKKIESLVAKQEQATTVQCELCRGPHLSTHCP